MLELLIATRKQHEFSTGPSPVGQVDGLASDETRGTKDANSHDGSLMYLLQSGPKKSRHCGQLCISILSQRTLARTCLLFRSEEHTSKLQQRSDLVCRL